MYVIELTEEQRQALHTLIRVEQIRAENGETDTIDEKVLEELEQLVD